MTKTTLDDLERNFLSAIVSYATLLKMYSMAAIKTFVISELLIVG